MPAYRLYHVKDGQFFHFDAFDAPDDAAAVAEARTLLGSDAAELWEGRRFICAFGSQEGRPRRGGRAAA